MVVAVVLVLVGVSVAELLDEGVDAGAARRAAFPGVVEAGDAAATGDALGVLIVVAPNSSSGRSVCTRRTNESVCDELR